MNISIETFGGNKDNYYNFKENYLVARKSIGLASIYLNPSYKNTNLVGLDCLVMDLKHGFDPVEFED